MTAFPRAGSGREREERRLALEQTLPLVLTSRVFAVRADLVGPQWGTADSLYRNIQDRHFRQPGG